MSADRLAASPVGLPPAPVSADALAPDPTRRLGRPKRVVLATVLGWNAFGMAVLWTLAAVADRLHTPVEGEDWTGVVVGIVVVLATMAIVVSAVIEMAVATARADKPDRLPPTTSTRRAIAIGTHTAAWALAVILVLPCWALISMLINGYG